MAAKRVINGVDVIPMGTANAFLIEGDDGLTLVDAGFSGKEEAVFRTIRGLGSQRIWGNPGCYQQGILY